MEIQIIQDLIYNNLIHIESDGSFQLNMHYFDYCAGLKMINKNFCQLFGKETEILMIQILILFIWILQPNSGGNRGIFLKICKNLKEKYSIDNICLAGGGT